MIFYFIKDFSIFIIIIVTRDGMTIELYCD